MHARHALAGALALIIGATTALAQTPPATEPPPEQDVGAEPPPDAPPPVIGEDELAPLEDVPADEFPEAPPADTLEEPPEEETPAPPATIPPLSSDDTISLPEWDADDWLLVKPRVSLLDLNGYFRLRGDLLQNIDFGNRSAERYQPATGGDAEGGRKADFTYANIRLRVAPTINVTENIQIHTTLDILDNLILGSTPYLPHTLQGNPFNLLGGPQLPPSDPANAFADSIQVKHAWTRITALNETLELRFGRMPDHWGLGMMVNDGSCLDCNYGDVVDRMALNFNAAGHVFGFAFDLISSGPQLLPYGRIAHPVDTVEWDDVEQYSLKVEKRSHPNDIKDALANDQIVINYGLWALWRRQDRDLPYQLYNLDAAARENGVQDFRAVGPVTVRFPNDLPETPFNEATWPDELQRDANIFTVDLYGELYWKTLRIGLEAAFIYGEFTDVVFPNEGRGSPQALRHEILQWGAALEASYRLSGDYSGVRIDFNAGAASGDSAPGFGALDRAATQMGDFGRTDSQGRPVFDRTLNNFQFSPDYHIDLLMYRQIIGTVTDSWYISPGVSYDFDENININGNVTFTSAMYKRSTPSCGVRACNRSPDFVEGQGSQLMGLEIDAEVSYGLFTNLDGNMLRGAVMGGVLFPFDAFRNANIAADDGQGGVTGLGPNLAWTIMARLYVTY